MTNITKQAYLISKKIQEENPGLLYWLVKDGHEGESIVGNLKMLGVNNAFLLDPEKDDFSNGVYNLGKKSKGVYLFSSGSKKIIQEALSIINDQIIELEVGQKGTPQALKKQLTDLGYSSEDFAAKGGVVKLADTKIIFDEDGVEEIIGSKIIVPKILDYSQVIKPKDLPKAELVSFNQTVYQLKDAPAYKKDFKALVKDLSNKSDYKIVISAIDIDVISKHLEKENFDPSKIQIIEQIAPAKGFIDEENKFLFLSHADIFGHKELKKRKRRDDAAFVTKLQLNDYVVHEDHGVARYLGLIESEIEGNKRENLLLEYAKGDKLYVPVEMAFKVDKYIGEAKPKLHRLSGTSWVRLSRKASQDSQEYAKELLKLYAQRSLIQTDSWIFHEQADKELHESFPFSETPDQEEAIKDVYTDLQKTTPMDRLVVGDVGFGKTEVAVRAAYQAVLNNKQVAILCPTTLLAQQHFDTFKKRFKSLGVKVEMLSRFTGKTKTSTVGIKDVVKGLEAGSIDIVIGTHRLLSKDINFKDIGLIIIDEEQRFGVKHKERLKALRSQTHILTMSATPIPRTLYFSLSGLRDISTIQTPPKGRQPIETIIKPYDEEEIKNAIKNELKRGGQVFYLYNHVQTINTTKKRLQDLLGAKVKIDIVHGQMPETEMARVTQDFDEGKIDVLVCTTIIENGLDIPNANTLVVHNATRYGLGQIYQIRGRIGRGKVKANAYFFYPVEGISGVAQKRLEILEEAKELGSGFQLAMRDLEMRGMGQLLGAKQHGQVQAVGLGLYGKLLSQAVEELESGEVHELIKTPTINLPFDYGIPESLIKDSEERVRLYRIVSQSKSLEEINEVLRDYDLSELSQPEKERLDNLIKLIEIRLKAEHTQIKSIDYQEIEKMDGSKQEQMVFEFREMRPEYVDIFYKVFDDFKVVENKIVIKSEDIKDYYANISNLLTKLS